MNRNRLLYLALRRLSAVERYMPLQFMYRLAQLAGIIAFYLVAPARRALLANLAVVMDLPESSPDLRRAARTAFQTDALNWVDTLRIGRLSIDDLVSLVDLDGWEHMDAAIAENRGVVLVTLHLGNFDLVGQVVEARGLHVTMPIERIEPPELYELLTASRRSQGVDLVPLDKAPRAMIRALRNHQIVAIAADRNIAGRAVEVQFFGKPALLPSSPASLARRNRTPVVIAVGVRKRQGRFLGIVRAVPLTFTDDEQRDERENTRRILAVLEPIIRRHADQWMMFAPVWEPSVGLDEAARIG